MSYVNAPATKLLATNCACCGRPLVDSASVEIGMGPICRGEHLGGIEPSSRDAANTLVHAAAIACQSGQIAQVNEIASKIAELGLAVLAAKIVERFQNAERLARIRIVENGDVMRIDTPFRRGESKAFLVAARMNNMTEYLKPTDQDAFLDFPPVDREPESRGLVECPQCKGHGGWNLRPHAYPRTITNKGLEDNPANRHRHVHFRAGCSHCDGDGFVRKSECGTLYDSSCRTCDDCGAEL